MKRFALTSRLRRWGAVAAVTLGAGCALSACGSSGSSSSSTGSSGSSGSTPATSSSGSSGAETTADAPGSAATGSAAVAAAEKFLAPYTSDKEGWNGPTSSPPIAKDKTVVFIDPAPTDEACTDVANASKEIGKVLGWNVSVVDEQNQDFQTAVETALQQKPDGLILNVAEPGPDTAGLKLIAASKIPTIDFIVGNEPSLTKTPGITHVVDFNYPLQGELLAAEAALETGGNAQLGLVNVSSSSSLSQQDAGIEEYFAKHGGGKVVATTEASQGILFTPALGQAAVAFAQANPDINVEVQAFDGMAATTVPALKSAGLSEKVKTESVEGDSVNINFIRTDQGQIGDAAPSFTWATYAAFDDLNRIFNGESPPAEDGVPVKLINSSDLPDEGQRFEGDYPFVEKYESLWHVGG